MSLEGRLAKKFRKGDYEDFSFTDIAAAEGLVTEGDRRLLHGVLSRLAKENIIYISNGRYRLSKAERFKDPVFRAAAEVVVGEMRVNERGFGFLVTDGGDYYVSRENMGYALHGDVCECAVIGGRSGKNDSAIVLKILDHTIKALAGTYFTEGAFSYLRPDDKHYLSDILLNDLGGFTPKMGDKLFVRITDFPKKSCPVGQIAAYLGRAFELSAEENSIILSCGIVDEFPAAVKTESARVEQEVGDNRLIGRLNLENEMIFTIDGDTAKDFDDAVSLTVKENGNFYLGVHIADVSEYVTPSSAMDREAFMRGTSAYFPDRVVPMLPFELSNGICSLNEGERRLTLSVFMEIDGEGNVVDKNLEESFIRSCKRLTYQKVQALFDGDEAAAEEYADVAPTLFEMLRLKTVLEDRRQREGYIDLAATESDVYFDGEKITVGLHKATDATKLIEQFMILANETVAEYLFYMGLPCVYRVHDKPDRAKTEQFKDFLKVLGINVQWRRDELYPKDYQRLLRDLEGTDKFAVVNRAMLRSMKKAVYSTENSGHFGLASKCYCHFTSPIRRYPDLLCHRVLKAAINGRIGEITDLYDDFYREAAKKSSDRERLCDEAERAVCDLYKVKYLEGFLGEEFIGVISGVNQHGLWVELENTCEGFVPIELLPGGFFEYDEGSFSLKSKKKSYKLGDKMAVAVIGCDISERKAEFMPAILKRHLQKTKKYGKI